jgi:hypothetical protein
MIETGKQIEDRDCILDKHLSMFNGSSLALLAYLITVIVSRKEVFRDQVEA